MQFYAVVWVAVRAGARFYRLLSAVTVLSVPFLFSGSAFVSGWFLPFWPFFALGAGVYAVAEAGRFPRGRCGRAALAGLGAALMAGGLAAAPLAPDGGRAMVLDTRWPARSNRAARRSCSRRSERCARSCTRFSTSPSARA